MKTLLSATLSLLCATTLHSSFILQPGDILVTDDRDQISPPQGAILLVRNQEQFVAYPNSPESSVLHWPYGIAFKGANSVYVSDYGKDDIFEIDLENGAASPLPDNGILVTPLGLALSSNGDLFIANTGAGSILRFRNGIFTVVSQGGHLTVPRGLTVEDEDHILVADSGVNALIRITLSAAGAETGENQQLITYGGWTSLRSVNVQGGSTYVADVSGLYRMVGNLPEKITTTMPLVFPYSVRLDSGGNLIVADPEGGASLGTIYSVTPAGNTTVITKDNLLRSPLDVAIVPAPRDSDNDGVADEEDACSHSILTTTVVVGSIDTNVPNTVFGSGCSISDLIAQCKVGAQTHGEFVACVSDLTNSLKASGLMTGKHKGAIESAVAKFPWP